MGYYVDPEFLKFMTFLIFGSVGLILGSFSNVLIYRIPRGLSIVAPPSSCPDCGHFIKWYENIPVLSFLFLHGKCSSCSSSISKRYPLIELLSMASALGIAFIFGLSWSGAFAALSLQMLIVMSAIDSDTQEAPDSLNLLAILLAVFAHLSFLESFKALSDAVFFAGGISLVRFAVSYVLQKEAIGEADIMIAATIGALVGLEYGVIAITFGSILMIIFALLKKEKATVAFIPFLTAGLWISIILKHQDVLMLLDK